MKIPVSDKLYRAAMCLELIVAFCVLLLCVLCGAGMVFPVGFLADIGNSQYFQARLSDASYIIIGIEFIKMIASHKIESVIDIMMVAISREMIVHNTTPTENLLSVLAVAILFVVRKYLYLVHSNTTSEKKDTAQKEP